MTKTFSPDEIRKLNDEFGGKSPRDLLKWAVDTFGNKVGLANSFGIEDMILTDMLAKVDQEHKSVIFSLDTGRLHDETYDTAERTIKKYGVQIKTYFPKFNKVEELVREKGFYSFRQSVENRKECCGIRKIEPLTRALGELDAWICGLRKEQSPTRADIAPIEIDRAHNNMIKINPIATWIEKEVWDYARKHDVPYNVLHDKNFPSIGCAPCTRAIQPGEDVRAGRWWWESPETKECGLHSK